MKFGDRIRLVREERNITRRDFAERLQISYFTLSKYETSEREPDFSTLVRIEDALHVSTDFILKGHEAARGQNVEDQTLILMRYRALPPDAQARIRNQLAFEYQQLQAQTKNGASYA